MAQDTSTMAPVGQFAQTPVRRLGLIVAGVALIALSAKIQVPFWPVPMTLQTLALLGIFAMSGTRLSLEIIFAYLAAGLMGLAVFAGPAAGPGYLMGPTAGFLVGFICAAFIVGRAADRGLASKPLSMIGFMLAAEVVIFTLGFLWLGFLFTTSTGATLGGGYAFANGVKPFIAGDLVKVVLAAMIAAGVTMGLNKGK